MGKHNWFFFIISSLCTNKLVLTFFWEFTTNSIKNNIYWHDTSKMSSFLNKFLRQFLAPAPDIIVIILFSNINTRHTLTEFREKIILYLWKSAKYTVLRTSIFNMWNNFLTAKNAVFSLGRFFFQFKWYQFGNPNTLYSLFLPWVYLYIR